MNHMFTPSCTDPVFAQWLDKGIKSISDLYKENTFVSFSQLSQEYQKNNFFRYFQIRSFVQNTFHPFPDKPSEWQVELKFDKKGLISQIYDLIQHINPHSTENLKKKPGILILESLSKMRSGILP